MERKPVARLSALAQGITKFSVEDNDIILVRDHDTLAAFAAHCPHAGAPLEQAAICDGRLVCPWHKAMFSLIDGALLEPPALDRLTRYDVTLDGDDILLSDAHVPPAPPRGHSMHVVVLGTGAAATACINELRAAGFQGRITAIGPEAEPPYDRTALSKFVLAGQMAVDDVPPLREPADWSALAVAHHNAHVTALDRGGRGVILQDGGRIDFDALVIATGATPKLPPLPGIDGERVLTLRNLADARRLEPLVGKAARVVILGASFIGLEAASALRERGLDVAIVSPEALPFARQFGEQAGAMFQRLHERHGVVFHLGEEAASIETEGDGVIVQTKSGQRVTGDFVLVGAGVSPATGFADLLTKSDDGGIVVDASMRAASGIYAIGDCATFPLANRHVCIEHWRLAEQHGRIAARAILGETAGYDDVPFFWTYHYGERYEYLGHPDGWDEVHIEGDLSGGDFVLLQLRGDHVVGALARGRETATGRLIVGMRGHLTRDAAIRDLRA